MGRPRKQEIELTATERASLSDLVRSRTAPQGLVRRARIVLASAEGVSNTAIARTVGLSIPAVGHWRKRFLEQGLAGLYGEQRPGRPRDHDDESVARLLTTVLQGRPRVGTHWTLRGAADATGISKSTVQRYLRLFGVQPHRSRTFKLSTDPLFVEKVRDIVGLYLRPPDHAVVLCVDEKSQIQALERTQPVLPMGLGYVDGITHDYKRHGTTTLFAALDVTNGQVLAQCKARHRHQEFLAFLRRIDAAVPAGLAVHLIVDNYATHKASQGPLLARRAAALPRSLHADLCFLAEPGRALVRDPDQPRDPPWLLRQRQGSGRAHHRLRRRLQRRLAAVRLDRYRRRHSRQDRPTL